MKNIKFALVTVMILGFFTSLYGTDIKIVNSTKREIAVSINNMEKPSAPDGSILPHRVIKPGDNIQLTYKIPDDFKVWVTLGDVYAPNNKRIFEPKKNSTEELIMTYAEDSKAKEKDALAHTIKVKAEVDGKFDALGEAKSISVIFEEQE